MRTFFFTFFFLLYLNNIQAQIVNSTTDRFNGSGTLGISKIGTQTMMMGFDNTEVTVKGHGYLDTIWHKGDIIFYPEDGKPINDKNPLTLANDLNIRWDIHRNEIDVFVFQKTLATAGSTVFEFSYLDFNGKKRVFRNIAAITKSEDKTQGFYEVLVDGKVLLLRKYETQIKNPTFNPALNIGDKDYSFLRTEGIYVEKRNIIEKLKAKESFLTEDLMKNHAKNVGKFIAENNLSLKKEADLVKLFSYYNTL